MSVSWKILLLMLCAGMAGTLARYLCLKLSDAIFPHAFPWGTLAVNMAGAFLAGLLFALSSGKYPELKKYLPVLMIGFLGAFTTFSTFALESAKFFCAGEYMKGACNMLIQNFFGILFIFGGIFTGKTLC